MPEKIESRIIPLSDNVLCDEPAAFLIFYYNDPLYDYEIKSEERDAHSFAEQQAERAWADLPAGSECPEWPIYALWPSDWPLKRSFAVPPEPSAGAEPQEIEAHRVAVAWHVFMSLPEFALKYLLQQAGIETLNLNHKQLVRRAVAKWFDGFPPNIQGLDRLEKES
jgi:hypothetical protein